MASLSDPWLPVESNPQVFNDFAEKLGWPTSKFVFQDLLSTEDWGIAMVPTPCLAIAMLYEINEAQESHRASEEVVRAAAAPSIPPSSLPFFMTQTIPNACGTIALIHACANLSKEGGGNVELPPESWLAKYTKAALPLTPLERVELIEKDKMLATQHAAVVLQGQSEVVDDTHQHFVLFLEKGGRLWELDGRKGGPIDCGPSSPGTLLNDSCEAVKKYMSRNPDSLRFTMLALAPPPEED